MCASLINLEADLRHLEEAGVEYLHIDVMDGHFVPNLMLPPDYQRALKTASVIPHDIHLMVERPESFLSLFEFGEGDIVSIHYESTPHVQRALSMVRERGATPFLAINPATPVECLRDVLFDIGGILVMTVNPGYSGQRLVPQCLQKIGRARAFAEECGQPSLLVAVDGNCSFENGPKMRAHGADIFVVGSSSVFNPTVGIADGTRRFRKLLADASYPMRRV